MLRLKFPFKFGVIGLLALLEFFALFYPSTRELRREIAVARLELEGLAVDKPLLNLIQVLQQRRGLSAGAMGGELSFQTLLPNKDREVVAALAAAESVMAAQGAGFDMSPRWAVFKQQWALLRQEDKSLTADASRAAHTVLIEELLQLIDHVGDASGLVLDPEASTYYLMLAATHQLPKTLELLGRLRAHGAGALARHELSTQGRTEFAAELAVFQAKRRELDVTLQKIASTTPQLAGRVREFGQQFREQTDALMQIVQNDIVDARFATGTVRYVELSTIAIDLGFAQSRELLIPLLEQLLHARIERKQADLQRGALLVVGFLLLFAYLAAGAYVAVITNLKALQDGADRVAAGNLSAPIALTAQDELQAVAQHFNRMSEELARRTDQLQATGTLLQQVRADYEKEHAQAVLVAVVPEIAHDISTPIGNITLAASSLRERLNEVQRRAREGGLTRSALEDFLRTAEAGLEVIEKGGARAKELAYSLKQLSIDQASERRRRFALDDLVSEVLTTFAPSLRGAKWRVERRIPAGLELDSYPGALGQVLLNLVQNAALHAFGAEGTGTLTLEAQTDGPDALTLAVRDDGRGMSASVLAKLFKPYFTTRAEQGGSGVGLAYARRLVHDSLGGQLEVSSAPGQGTTFFLHLPLQAPAAKPTLDQPS
ncbi:MAG: ATP-binding protein [Inhella sp.]